MKKYLFSILAAALFLCSCTSEKSPEALPVVASNQAVPIETVEFFSGKNGSQEGIKCPIKIVPGKSIGPIEIGMPKGNLLQIGLGIKQLKDSPNNILVGPYMVTMANEKIFQAAAEIAYLKNCVELGNQPIPQDATFDQLKKILPNCGNTESSFGGNVSKCDGIIIKQGSGQDSVPVIEISL